MRHPHAYMRQERLFNVNAPITHHAAILRTLRGMSDVKSFSRWGVIYITCDSGVYAERVLRSKVTELATLVPIESKRDRRWLAAMFRNMRS